MAFGKDPRLALAGGSLRQTVQSFGRDLVTRGPKGRLPYFVDQYTPTVGSPDTIRLIAGHYLQQHAIGTGDDVQLVELPADYITFTEHFLGSPTGKGKSAICSAGPFANIKSKRAPCRGCDIFWETAVRDPKTNRLESKTISRVDKYVISVLDYGPYHKLESIDHATGQLKINNKTGEAFFNWVKCQGQGCDACRAGKEKRFGNMSHWPMSYTHNQVLIASEVNIGQSCAVCRTMDLKPDGRTESPIRSLVWACRHCGEPAIDMSNTSLKWDEIYKLTDRPYECPACGEKSLLREEIICVECEKLGQVGKRAGLFDVDIRVQLTEVPGQKAKMLQVMGWSPPRPVAPDFAEMAVPVDLVARYAPDSMEYQISRFGAAPPTTGRTPVTGAPGTQPFTNYGPKTS
jgi:hypothetical protein